MQPNTQKTEVKSASKHVNNSQLEAYLIDYKNIDLLKKFLNPHARIVSKKRTGVSTKNQRLIANAVKRARFLGLLPYVAR